MDDDEEEREEGDHPEPPQTLAGMVDAMVGAVSMTSQAEHWRDYGSQGVDPDAGMTAPTG